MTIIWVVNRSHRCVVSFNCEWISLRIICPKLDSLIFRCTSYLITNRWEFNISDSIFMPDILVHTASWVEIPDEYHTVIRARDNLFSALNINVTPEDGNLSLIFDPCDLLKCLVVWDRGRLLSLFKYTVVIIVICSSIVVTVDSK